MHSHAIDWDKVCSSSNLVLAFRKARRGKTLRDSVRHFSQDLRRNLRGLQASLRSGLWHPSAPAEFLIFEPKERKISAAPFPDRVVHHALMNLAEPIFESFQIYHSYACRKGKGTHACVAQAYENQRHHAWFLRLDIRKYFESIPHEMLLSLLSRHFRSRPFLAVMEELVRGRGNGAKGIPIGNLTSQHLANFYLAHLDHFVLQQLRPSAYVRYMDDFVLWGTSRQELSAAKTSIESWLGDALQLELKSSVTELAPCRQGLAFLGFRILPDRIRLAQRSLKRLRSRVRKIGKTWGEGDASSLEAAYAFARTAHTGGLRRRFGAFLATRGKAMEGLRFKPRQSGWQLEQQSRQPALGQSEQQHPRQPQQQFGVPLCVSLSSLHGRNPPFPGIATMPNPTFQSPCGSFFGQAGGLDS